MSGLSGVILRKKTSLSHAELPSASRRDPGCALTDVDDKSRCYSRYESGGLCCWRVTRTTRARALEGDFLLKYVQ